MTKLGIVSFAHMHAHNYAACIRVSEDAELCGVWDADARRGRSAARTYHTKYYSDLESLYASGLDGVIICSENVRHREQVLHAAEAGLWVLCEKPLATTIDDAKEMVEVCDRAGVGLGVAFPCRFSAPIAEAKRAIESGEIGDVISATCTNNGKYPGGWFADPALSGGGAVMDHTVHVADALRWMLGQEFLSVYCTAANRFHPEIEVDDVGSLQLEMDGGAIVSHVASWNRPEGFPTWGDVTMELVGTLGSIRVNVFNQKAVRYPNANGAGEWIGWGANANAALTADFVDSIREGRSPFATAEDGLRAVEVTVAAQRSAERGVIEAVR